MKDLKQQKQAQQAKYYAKVQNRGAAPARVNKSDSYETFRDSASRYQVKHV